MIFNFTYKCIFHRCATPRGLTNSISLVVAVSQCPTMNEPQPPLSLRLEGIKLGQRAIYRCPMGYMLQGTENATCLASGNWSSPAPTCIPIQCPPLFLEDPHLSLVKFVESKILVPKDIYVLSFNVD